MLLQLRIRNFAIIEDLLVSFEEGLVTLTGETGAGKSIIIDALSACLGGRTGAAAIRYDADLAEIEAVFSRNIADAESSRVLEEHGLDGDDDLLILTREIGRNGRSLARVNRRTVPLSVLSALGDRLIDLHGQSEHLSLLKPSRQLQMLDRFADVEELRRRFAEKSTSLTEIQGRLAQMRAGQRTAEARLDYLRFQIDEIDRANLREGEEEYLLRDRVRLANAEKLAALATTALTTLQDGEHGPAAVEALGESTRTLAQLVQIDPNLEGVRQGLEDIRLQTEELVSGLRRYRDGIEFDPRRLDDAEERLDLIHRLERKYGDTVADIIAFRDEAGEELAGAEGYDRRVEGIEATLEETARETAVLATRLTTERVASARKFAGAVRERLLVLGLGEALFEVSFTHIPSSEGLEVSVDGSRGRFEFTSTGIDRIAFMVSFNKGEPLRPIEKVASGGETARFMLAVKATLASLDDVPTLIFDEIDTGVGGRSGHVVGAMLKELARSHQVITITHLPQIAAQAAEHLKVVKLDGDERAGVAVVRLDRDGRIHELAEMLAGPTRTEASIKSAEELLAAVSGGRVEG